MGGGEVSISRPVSRPYHWGSRTAPPPIAYYCLDGKPDVVGSNPVGRSRFYLWNIKIIQQAVLAFIYIFVNLFMLTDKKLWEWYHVFSEMQWKLTTLFPRNEPFFFHPINSNKVKPRYPVVGYCRRDKGGRASPVQVNMSPGSDEVQTGKTKVEIGSRRRAVWY